MEADNPTPIAELEHGPSKFEQFLEENQKLVFGGAIAIFLGVLGYVGYTSYAKMAAANTGKALVEADNAESLEKVLNDYPNTPTAASAAILLAEQLTSTEPDRAAEKLKLVIDQYPDSATAPIAATKLGLSLLKAGKLDEAKAQLSAVIDMKHADYIIPAAKIALADIAQQQGDIDLAKQLYNEVITAGRESTEQINKFAGFTSIANSRLAILGVSSPKEVPAPTKPDAAAETTPATDATPTQETTPAASTPTAPSDSPASPTDSEKKSETPQ